MHTRPPQRANVIIVCVARDEFDRNLRLPVGKVKIFLRTAAEPQSVPTRMKTSSRVKRSAGLFAAMGSGKLQSRLEIGAPVGKDWAFPRFNHLWP